MARRKDDDSGQADLTEQEFADLSQAMDGGPVLFSVNGRQFGIRQVTPVEMDSVRLQEGIAYHKALALPEMQVLKALPVSDDAKRMRQLEIDTLSVALDEETDSGKRRELSRRLDIAETPDTRSLAEELAENDARRQRDRWMVERFLVNADGASIAEDDKATIINSPAAIEAARPAVWRVLKLATELPNWNGRTASDTT